MTHFTLNIMTATLAPGDAIGNYILTSARLWREWGVRVKIFADFVAPVYGGLAQHSSFYIPTGQAILWYHYSIYAENVEIARHSPDFKVMDYHGISPARLFTGQNSHLEKLCQQAIDLLPQLAQTFDLAVVHSEYTRQELIDHGFEAAHIHKLPLCVDTTKFEGQTDEALASQLQKLEYLLFIGRVVPQKDVLALLEIFAELHALRPTAVLILVGSRAHADAYQRELDQRIVQLGLSGRVMFTEQVNDPAVLATLLRHAKLLLVTSEWETFCVPVAESMFFGVPPVIHNVPPLPEVAGSAGTVIDKRQPRATAVALHALLNDPVRYQTLSQAALARANDFTDAALATSLLTMLQREFPHAQPAHDLPE